MKKSYGRIMGVLQREGRALPFSIRGWREQSLESHKQPHQSQKEGFCTLYKSNFLSEGIAKDLSPKQEGFMCLLLLNPSNWTSRTIYGQ